MRLPKPRLAEWMPAFLAAVAVPLLSGMIFVFVAEAGSFLVSSYAPRALRRAGWSAAVVQDAARWAAPLLNACLTAVLVYQINTREERARPSIWVLAATSTISFLVLGLTFGFRFSVPFRRGGIGLWYSLGVPLTFATGVAGGLLGRYRWKQRRDLVRILAGSGAGGEGVRGAVAEYARFASVPAVHAVIDGRAVFASTPGLERHRPVLEAAGGRIAGLWPGVASGGAGTIGVRRLPHDMRRLLRPIGIRSLAFLPLGGADGAAPDFALLYFTRPALLAGNRWQSRLLASQLALGLENARLLETARRSAVLEERQRLAREIHDTIAQDLIGIIVNLEELERAGSEGSGEPAGGAERLGEAVRTARRGLQETRRLVWALRPVALEENPLPAALSRSLREWSFQSGIEAEFCVEGEPYRLQPDAEITFFRMLQEACSNIARHAKARHAWVRLRFAPGEVVLSVRDDGAGMEEAREEGKGFGLSAMRQRIESLGGKLMIHSGAGAGTELSAAVPRVGASVPEGEDGENPRPDR